jgi:predicted nucleic acid-binding Zn ribbon protein
VSDGRSEPRRLGEALDRLVQSMGAPSVTALEKIFGNWPGVVGPEVAQHSKPVRLDRDQLTVEVDDPAWASQLRWMSAQVLAALDREVGEGTVKGLKVRVSGDPK